MDVAECLDEQEASHRSYRKEKGRWLSPFFGYYDDVYAKKFTCVSVQGTAYILKDLLLKSKEQ